MGRRCASMLMALTITLNPVLSTSVVYAEETGGTESTTKTLSSVIAENYTEDLTDEEKAFLLGVTELTGESFTYTVPEEDNSDGYVVVDSDAKIVTIKETNEFKAVGAYLVDANGDIEEIRLTDNKGTFESNAQIYSIKVDYEYNATVSEANQSTLLEAVYYLSEAIENFDAVADLESNIATLTNTSDGGFLGMLYPYAKNGIVWGTTTMEWNSEGGDYVIAMCEDDEYLEILTYIDEYQAAPSKVEYLIENGQEYRNAIDEFSTIMSVFVDEDDGVKDTIELGARWYEERYGNLAKVITDILEGTEEELEAVSVKGVWSTDAEGNLDYDKYFQEAITRYEGIDSLVEAATNNTTYKEVEVSETLLVDTLTITANVAQCNVDVEVSGYEYINGVKTDLTTYTATLVLPENATASEITAAIKEYGIEESSVTAWGIDTDFYTSITTGMIGESELLTGPITVQIEYQPAKYTIEYEGESSAEIPSENYEYGDIITFASHLYEDQSYDYTAEDGTIYNQGDTYIVKGDETFTVTEGKAKDESSIKDLVADTYADDLGDYASILKSSAIISDTVKYRVPDDSDGLMKLVEGAGIGGTVTAQAYTSGIAGATWIPTTLYVITSGENDISITMTSEDNKTYTGTFESADFDRVEVEYKLVISTEIIDFDTIREYLNIPYELVEEYEEQKAAMDDLQDQEDTLTNIPATYLNTLNSLIKDADRGFTDESIEAMQTIMDVSLNNENELILLDYIDGYDKDGMIYYYENYEEIISQIDYLSSNLQIIIKKDEEKLVTLINDLRIAEYDGETLVTDLKEALIKLEAIDLVEPDGEHIDLDSNFLSNLLTVFQNVADSSSENDSAPTASEAITVTTRLSQDASSKASITVNVQVKDSSGNIEKTYTGSHMVTIEGGYTKDDIEAIEAIISTLKAEAEVKVDKAYYDVSTYILPTTSDDVASQTITITYSPKKYTVNISEDEYYTFYYDNPVITLEEPASSDSVYKYTIDGGEVRVTCGSTTTYRFKTEQIERLFVNTETLTITKEVISVFREDILKFVEALNDHDATYTEAGSDYDYLQVAYIPVEEADGTISIVVRVSPTAEIDTETIFASLGTAIIDGGYTYVEVGGNTLRDGTTISIQALADAVLASGISLAKLGDVIDEEGNIVEMFTDSKVSVLSEFENNMIASIGYDNDDTLYGGKLISTTLTLSEDGTEIPIYITIEDFDKETETLKSLKTTIDTMKESFNLATVTDATTGVSSLELTLNLDDQYYTAYAALMLITEKVDIQDFNAELSENELSTILTENLDLLKPLFGDDVELDDIQATLSEFITSVDVSGYETVYNLLKELNIEFVSSEDNVVEAKITYDVSTLKESFGDYANVITLAEDEITIPTEIIIENYDTDYQALIIDTSNVMSSTITASLSDELSTVNEGATIVLLSDVDDLNFKTSATLDLNGYTVIGDISATSTLAIIDSRFESQSGEVTGTLSGDITVYAGKYSAEALTAATIPTNYEQDDDDYVVNTLFTITEVESESGTEINVELSAEVINKLGITEINTLTMPLIYDLLLNCYTDSSMSIGENEIYNLADVANYEIDALIDCLNLEGINGFADELISAFTDFETIASAISEEKPILTYDISTTDWELALEQDEADGTFDFNIGTSEEISNTTLNITIGGDEDDIAQTVAIFEALRDTTDLTVTLDVESLEYSDATFTYDYSLDLKAAVDLLDSDNYAYMLGIMVNYLELNTDIVAAIEAESINDLKVAIDKVDAQVVINAIEQAASISYSDMMTGFTDYDYETEYTTLYYLAGQMFQGLYNADLTGSTFGEYESDEYGVYVLSDDAGVTTYNLELKMFNEEVIEEVIVYDVVAINSSGGTVYEGDNLATALATDGVTKVTINDSVSLTKNVTLSSSVEIAEASKISFGSYKLTISKTGVTLKTDAKITSYVSAPSYYQVDVSGTYSYNISAIVYDVVATNSSNTIVYRGENLADALATSGVTKVTINDKVSLGKNVTISSSVQIVGASKISFGSYKLTLSKEGITLTTDASIQNYITTGTDYDIQVSGTYQYSLVYKTPSVTSTSVTVDKTDGFIRGAEIDESASQIIIDVSYQGISSSDFQKLISSTYVGTTSSVVVSNTTSGGLMKTGSTYAVTAKNSTTGKTTTKTYTVIVLGDVNGDGMANAFDANTITQIRLGNTTPTTLQSLASDVNNDGSINAFDCLKLINKRLEDWDDYSYESAL